MRPPGFTGGMGVGYESKSVAKDEVKVPDLSRKIRSSLLVIPGA